MSKDYTFIKANGLRKELQAINQSIRELTEVLKNQASNEKTTTNCRFSYCSKQPGECFCTNERGLSNCV